MCNFFEMYGIDPAVEHWIVFEDETTTVRATMPTSLLRENVTVAEIWDLCHVLIPGHLDPTEPPDGGFLVVKLEEERLSADERMEQLLCELNNPGSASRVAPAERLPRPVLVDGSVVVGRVSDQNLHAPLLRGKMWVPLGYVHLQDALPGQIATDNGRMYRSVQE